MLIAVGFFINMLGTTLPTPLYPLYEANEHLAAILIPVIFATYAVAVIAGLLVFGHQSDRIGRKMVLIAALVLSGLSAVAFLLAHGLPGLLAGRVLSGVSAGMFTGSGTAALVDFVHPQRRRIATNLAVVANLGGLAFGLLASGLLAQFVPFPLRVPYAFDLALVVLAVAGVSLAPETRPTRDRRIRLEVQSLRVPPEIRGTFIAAGIAGICGFAVSGVFSAVAPDLLVRELHVSSPAVAGTLVFLLMATSAGGQLVEERLPKRYAFAIGCVLLAVGLGCLAVAIALRALALLFLAAFLCGAGQGLVIGFGLANINERVDAQVRGQVTSTYFVWIYAGLVLPVIGVGFLGRAIGLPGAGIIFCAVVGVSVLASLQVLRPPAENSPRT